MALSTIHTVRGGENVYNRQYLSDKNGQKVDAVRQQIEAWRQDGINHRRRVLYPLTLAFGSGLQSDQHLRDLRRVSQGLGLENLQGSNA